MRILFISILSILLSSLAFAGEKDVEIKVEFIREGKGVCIDEHFQVYLIAKDSAKKIIIKPVFKKSSFIFPSEWSGKLYALVFKYKNDTYAIGVADNGLVISEAEKWVIKFDKKPYNMEYHYGDRMYKKDIKAVLFLRHVPAPNKDVNSLVINEGYTDIVLIKDIRSYKNKSKRLLE